jgi:3',5'-cyclic AMP phosphodiesterase CpdA
MTRVLHLSDPHFGAADSSIAEIFLAKAAELSPDLTILSGDLSMRARHEELTEAKQFVASLPTPYLVIPGNHDVPGLNQPLDRFFTPFRRYQSYFGKTLEPEFKSPGFHVVSLNSTRAFGFHADWSEGILSSRQLSRMKNRFVNAERDFRILVLHHPLLAPPNHTRSVVKPLPALLSAISECQIDLVLCGHFHRSLLAVAGSVNGWTCVVSQAATVCSTRLQGEPQGFHEILIEDDHIEIIRYVFDEGQFTPTSTTGFLRDQTGWHPPGLPQSHEIISPV